MNTVPKNVESFELDHTKVAAPYIRRASDYEIADGHTIVKYDLRFRQPNKSHIEMSTMHAIEHSMAEALRDHLKGVIDFGPMGCQTGFYLTVDTTADGPTWDEVADAVKKAIADIEKWDSVPGAGIKSCGWAEHHDLDGAKKELADFDAHSDEWNQVFA
ncbi:S-ribosylhomocysteine lyase [Corynebacterium kroppenstedtii]|nr:S-ribosylhomocysteine lyase [Corynebacterium pseudokroppenstedtii]QRP10406.1 S-ribosylhomocysteine lyase [Corynebacterium kroppenstedtii]QRP13948.1 S-ribosylhomocysteine lyase [Corynebacterium kroppenstedtii]